MMRRLIAAALCVALLAPGCVSSQGPRLQTAPAAPASSIDREVLGEFAGRLDLGTRVRVTVTGNRTIRGTLVKRTADALVLQPRTRVPEPLVEIEARGPAGHRARGARERGYGQSDRHRRRRRRRGRRRHALLHRRAVVGLTGDRRRSLPRLPRPLSRRRSAEGRQERRGNRLLRTLGAPTAPRGLTTRLATATND